MSLAARLGVKPETVRTYYCKRERYGMPQAEHVGRTPVWREKAIEAWGAGWLR